MLISAYFPLKKVGGNCKSEEKSAFETEKSKRKLRNPQNTEPRRGAAGKSLKKFRRGLT